MSTMQFKSIQVDQFRQFTGTHLIENLGPGLNIIAGSNEAGKSTLLMAIRAALFDRYKSSIGESFRPYNAAVSPKVRLEFSVDGVDYTLEKVFSSKKDGGVSLTASNGHIWEGPEAEDFLSELLGFAYPGRGASKPEHQGLSGLLWVEQAKAYERVSLQDDSRQQIQSVFEDEMRELLGGDKGDQLHQRIEALRAEFFGATENPVGEYRRLIGQEETLSGELDAKRVELSEYENKIDQLERLEQRLAEFQADSTLDNLKVALAAAEEKERELTTQQQAVQVDEQKVAAAQALFEKEKQSFEARQGQLESVELAAAEVDRLTELVAAKERDIEPIKRDLENLRGQGDDCKARRREVVAGLRVARSYEKVEQVTERIVALDSDIKSAEEARRNKLGSEQELESIRVDEDMLGELKELAAQVANRKARLEAVATRLDYDLQPDAAVTLKDDQITNSGSVRVTEAVNLRVEGMGAFVITPGGDDIESLKAEIRDLEGELQDQLSNCAVADVAEAESSLKQKELLARDVSRYRGDYERIAPEGLEALQDSLVSLQAQRTNLLEEIGDFEQEDLDIAKLESQEADFSDEIEQLEGQVAAKDAEREASNNILVGANGSLAPERDRLVTLRAQLDEDRSEMSDQDLKAAMESTEEAFKTLSLALDEAKQSIEEQNPDAVATEVERLRTAEENVGNQIEELKRDIRDSKIELTALGHQGLSEEVANAADAHSLIATRLNAMRKKAEALDLLHRVLSEALSRAKQAVAQPVIDKILPHIRQLIPGAEPVVDEALGLVGINRGGTIEAFDELSIGTREQLAVLLRLAYADLLSESGVPVSVVLDDALVNSDDDRRDSMKSILYQSARNYQVIVLTCHGREYADAGGTFIRLEEVA